jgi:hypothetical protein
MAGDTYKFWLLNRKIIKGRTKELIEEADLILAHYSDALKYAKDKEVIFLTSDILHWKLQEFINLKAKEFGKTPVNF